MGNVVDRLEPGRGRVNMKPYGTEMDNAFITDLFDGWKQAKPSHKVCFVNRVLAKLGLSARLSPPISTGAMTSVEQRINIFHLASSVLFYEVPGGFVELGCHEGQTAVLLQNIIRHYDKSRELHVYDSFEGLPAIQSEDGDTPFSAGQMATTEDTLLANFKRAGLVPPVIHPGWFEDTLSTQLPEPIAFAHLDGDLYESVRVSLEHVYPKLSKGSVCLIDDYADLAVLESVEMCPGVKRACDEFLQDKPESVALLYGGYDSKLGFGSHGFFRKL